MLVLDGIEFVFCTVPGTELRFELVLKTAFFGGVGGMRRSANRGRSRAERGPASGGRSCSMAGTGQQGALVLHGPSRRLLTAAARAGGLRRGGAGGGGCGALRRRCREAPRRGAGVPPRSRLGSPLLADGACSGLGGGRLWGNGSNGSGGDAWRCLSPACGSRLGEQRSCGQGWRQSPSVLVVVSDTDEWVCVAPRGFESHRC